MVPVPHTACVFELSFELRGHVGSPAPSGLSPIRTGQELTSGEKRGRPSSVTRVRSPCFPGVPPEIRLPGVCPGSASDVIRSNSHSFPSVLPAAHPSSQVLGYTCRLRHPGHQHPASGAPSRPLGVSTGVTGLVCCLSLRAVWGGGGDSPRSPRGGRRLHGSSEGSPLPAAPGAGQIPAGVRADGAPMGRGAAGGRWVCVRTCAAGQAPTGTMTNRGGRGGPADCQKAWLVEPHLTCV